MISAFRRGKSSEETPPAAETPSVVACSIRGCDRQDAQPCTYVDRRGRTCGTACCPAHGISVDGATYCRRHAGTVQAVGTPEGNPGGNPDLNDRAPSLVNWIARDLDKAVRANLNKIARPGETIIADEHVHLARDQIRRTRWSRSWRLIDHTGLVLKVTVYTNDDDDSTVHILVGGVTVPCGVPPWIARRKEGADVDAAVDISQRLVFSQALEQAVAEAVAQATVIHQR
jgi:hypothetical protein